MNLTLIAAIVALGIWLVLLVHQVPSGFIHVFYAGAVILFVRRIIVGAPKFLS